MPVPLHRLVSTIVIFVAILCVYYYPKMRDGYAGFLNTSEGGGDSAVVIKYTTIPEFFMQDDSSTDPKGYDYTLHNFGLIDRPYDTDDEFDPTRSKTQWQRLEYFISELNKKNPDNVAVKLLYVGRHGEGYHNVAMREYGDHDWDEYWSKQSGDSEKTWMDSLLTDAGEQQAKVNREFWAKLLSAEKAPAPEFYYTSPLTRCLQTCKITFGDLELPETRPFKPHVKELLRETIGEHLCDKRSSLTYIRENFPFVTIEPSFSESDELWTANAMESRSDRVERLRQLLDDIFTHDGRTFLSFTSHSGAITALLQAIGHRSWPLGTAGMVPLLVMAERVDGGKLPKS